MQTGSVVMFNLYGKMRPLNGIPWRALTRKQYMAVTCDGILYVPLRAFGPESDGVAFNPKTNHFPSTINGFKPVGGGRFFGSRRWHCRSGDTYISDVAFGMLMGALVLGLLTPRSDGATILLCKRRRRRQRQMMKSGFACLGCSS